MSSLWSLGEGGLASSYLLLLASFWGAVLANWQPQHPTLLVGLPVPELLCCQ